MLGSIRALHDFAQQAQRHRVAQVGLEVEQQVHARLAVLFDRLQHQTGVGRVLGFLVVIQIQALEAIGDAPAKERPQRLRDRMTKAFDDAGFLAGFDDQQGRAGANQGDKILVFSHVGCAQGCEGEGRAGVHSGASAQA